jgi:hypothetical protein
VSWNLNYSTPWQIWKVCKIMLLFTLWRNHEELGLQCNFNGRTFSSLLFRLRITSLLGFFFLLFFYFYFLLQQNTCKQFKVYISRVFFLFQHRISSRNWFHIPSFFSSRLKSCFFFVVDFNVKVVAVELKNIKNYRRRNKNKKRNKLTRNFFYAPMVPCERCKL